jgi:hypothetical protein
VAAVIVEKAGQIRVGPAYEKTTGMGPVVNEGIRNSLKTGYRRV